MTVESWLDSVRCTARGSMRGGGKSPYKPLLLAAVLCRVMHGKQLDAHIRLDRVTVAFYGQLRELAFPHWPHRDDPGQPFVRLAPEVWSLHPVASRQSEFSNLLSAGSGVRWQEMLRVTESATLPQCVHLGLCSDVVVRKRVSEILLQQLVESGADPEGLKTIAHLLAAEGMVLASGDPVEPRGEPLEYEIEEHLVDRWPDTPFAKRGVFLHTNDRGEIVGQQYPAGKWFIDLLGWQPSEACWWVIELKRGRASDQVMGQVGRYIGWVQCHLARPSHETRGIILARSVSEGLEHACYSHPKVEAWTFDEGLRIHAH